MNHYDCYYYMYTLAMTSKMTCDSGLNNRGTAPSLLTTFTSLAYTVTFSASVLLLHFVALQLSNERPFNNEYNNRLTV